MYKYSLTVFLLLVTATVFAQQTVEQVAEKLAQEQLDAYNKRDIDAFVAPYADNVKVYKFPNELLYEGKTTMYDTYGRMFARTPDLHCRLVNRIVMGNTVIDQEEVTISKKDPPMNAIAIYKIIDGKIAEVYFIQ
ncbi:nuclear transport factor 2 family protein [Cognataquiflexum aquatile]|uniref:nuclear transport factor 2 family protein n=1 Tax=Cognataquiflexum aquatile TaxID=2249427 RepID=UPI001E3A8AF3|nr:nuclear transport factor 2 family protein [Cognataquiflexum aquatile]